MKDDVLALLLQTEIEYNSAIKAAVENAGKYVDDRRQEQQAYIAGIKSDLDSFERTESEMLEQTLSFECSKMEQEADRRKEQMRALKEKSADKIAQRLKEEVFTLLWQ